jgi:hypothetical protein
VQYYRMCRTALDKFSADDRDRPRRVAAFCRRSARNGTIGASKWLGFATPVMAGFNPCGLALGGGLV